MEAVGRSVSGVSNMESHSFLLLSAACYTTALEMPAEFSTSAPSFNCSALHPPTARYDTVLGLHFNNKNGIILSVLRIKF